MQSMSGSQKKRLAMVLMVLVAFAGTLIGPDLHAGLDCDANWAHWDCAEEDPEAACDSECDSQARSLCNSTYGANCVQGAYPHQSGLVTINGQCKCRCIAACDVPPCVDGCSNCGLQDGEECP